MLYEELTGKILEACFEVSKELGVGYIESVYEKALLIALKHKNIQAVRQVPLKVAFRGAIVGDFSADMFVEGKVLLELKVVDGLAKEHYAELLNYLKTTGIAVGMIINFGTPKLQYRRFDNRFGSDDDLDINKAMRDLLSE